MSFLLKKDHLIWKPKFNHPSLNMKIQAAFPHKLLVKLLGLDVKVL